ncbi:MAG: GNAT family N-acetyltransferase [Planctomycetia bacterium]|nr:GNAT family N-acetyltransferase [Planctomycetia bacterium]
MEMVVLASVEKFEETQINPTLDSQIRLFLCEQFPDWASVFQYRRTWHDAPPVFTVLAFNDNNEIIGHVAIVERTITTCWNWRYTVASFQGVSVAEEERHSGLAHQLLSLAIKESTKLGYLFAILFCKEPLISFYHDQGWQLPDDSMIMWKDHDLPIPMRSNCPMFLPLSNMPFPEGPIDVHNPL